MLAVVVLVLIVVVPYIFESYTFYLYTTGDQPIFFAYSGAREWFFLTYILSSGLILGRFFQHGFVIYSSGLAVSLLIALLYQFCEVRQCYYSGPDGFGWLRLWSVFLLTAFAGIFLGRRSIPVEERTGASAFFFAATVALFSGFYPMALLYGTLTTQPLNSFLLIWASTIPFLFAGLIIFSSVKKLWYAVYSSATSSVILVLLLSGLGIGNLLPLVIIPGGILTGIMGYKIAQKLLSNKTSMHKPVQLLFALVIPNFFFFAIHPYIDAPMNLSVSYDSIANPYAPTYYSAAFMDENHKRVKRIEVEMNFDNFDKNSIQQGNFLAAGIGAQSPNCCKDGIDYGYRADVLFSDKGETFLLARAWETCDQNIACSAAPWQLKIHEAVVPFKLNSSTVMLAMGWNEGWEGREASWYYRTSETDWSIYSTFTAPQADNPYFNIGRLKASWAFGSSANPPAGEVYHYQFGVSMSEKIVDENSSITFTCPAYYLDGMKHCVRDMGAIRDGGSHWKVLWKWGKQSDDQVIIDEENNMATIRFMK